MARMPTARPMPAVTTAATAPYVEAMKNMDPALDPDYFRIVKVGGLRMGIGSALDKKYLMQIRGATDTTAEVAQEATRPVLVIVGIAVVLGAFLLGRRRGQKRSTIVEVRRV